jgi:(2Fe-2S) ferredoxin
VAKRPCYIFLCVNERPAESPKGSCLRNGADAVRDRFQEAIRDRGLRDRVRVVRTSCLDNCSQGPVLAVYPDDVWYRGVQAADVDAILERHLEGGAPVDRLVLPPEEFD